MKTVTKEEFKAWRKSKKETPEIPYEEGAKGPGLPPDHPVRKIPEDLHLYNQLVSWFQTEKIRTMDQYDRRSSDISKAAYAIARAEHVPGKAVSKILTLIRRYLLVWK